MNPSPEDPKSPESPASTGGPEQQATASSEEAAPSPKPEQPWLIGAFEDEIMQVLQERFAAVEHDLTAPLRQALGEAAAAHHTLLANLERAALDPNLAAPAESATPVPGRVLWDALRTYRRGLLADVVTPLAAHLEMLDTGNVLAAERQTLIDALAALADSVPIHVLREEPGDLYKPEADDPALHRARKAAVRLQRYVTGDEGHLQSIPLRHLAAYHVQVRVPEILAPALRDMNLLHTAPMATLETQMTTHTHTVLELERLLDRPPYHEPLSLFAEVTSRIDTLAQEATFDVTTAAATLRQAYDQATAFDQQMEEQINALDRMPALASQATSAVRAATAALGEDVEHAESFMLDLDDRKIETVKTMRRLDGQAEIVEQWHRRVAARLRFCEALLAFRDEVGATEEALVQAIYEATVLPAQRALMQTEQALRALHTEMQDVFDPHHGEPAYAARHQEIDRLLQAALASVERDLLPVLREEGLSRAARETAQAHTRTLTQKLHSLPAELQVNGLQEPDAQHVEPDIEPRTVRLRTFAEQAYDAFLFERLLASVLPLAQTLSRVQVEIEGVPSILHFNLESAGEELLIASQAPKAEARDEHVAAAQELALGGLDRSADVLAAQVSLLTATMPALTRAVHEVIERGFISLHERVRVEGHLQEHLLDLRERLARRMRELAEAAQEQAERGGLLLRRRLRLGRSRAEALLRLGQAAVGVAPTDGTELKDTVEALADVEALLDRLPAVYRRLFSFLPVKDPALMAGRDADLDRLRKHVEQWRGGFTNAFVLTGPYGSGLTSMLNAARQTILTDASVHAVEIRTRLRTEAEVARQLAPALGAPSEAAASLETLAHHLMHSPPPAKVQVCFIEHLEHLFLRKVGGTGLLDRVLTFLSQTDSHVLWMGTTSNLSWQFVQKTEPAAASLVVQHALAPLDRAALETLILSRHQRSGMPLVFDTPALEKNPLLRRRLRKVSKEEDKQAILRVDYFDRLYRAGGQNVMLALLYWLRSVQVDEAAETVHVRPITPLSFAFLSAFDLPRAFTLKSLLEHGTLTVDEHSEIFQIPPAESMQLLESLGNLLLIEPAPEDLEEVPRGRFAFSAIEHGVRYRLQPLVIHPVTAYLQNKNIVH